MEGESVRIAITEVQSLLKAVELAQRGIDTEESREVAMCMQAAHQQLEWVYSKLARQSAHSSALHLVKGDGLG